MFYLHIQVTKVDQTLRIVMNQEIMQRTPGLENVFNWWKLINFKATKNKNIMLHVYHIKKKKVEKKLYYFI